MSVSLSSTSLALANGATTSAAQEDPTTSALNKLSPSLGKAHERVRAQLQSDSASLSQLGKYKATVSDLAAAAQSLGQLDVGANAVNGIQTVERFVAAYNQAITASQASASGDTSSTLAASRRNLTNADTSRSQLAKLGISRQSDGTLKLDTTTLKKALSTNSTSNTTSIADTGLSTLAQLGKAIGKRAASELSANSRIATATTLYTDKASQLKRQQSRLQEVAFQLTAQVSSSTTNSDWTTQQALRKYTS